MLINNIYSKKKTVVVYEYHLQKSVLEQFHEIPTTEQIMILLIFMDTINHRERKNRQLILLSDYDDERVQSI